MHLCSSCKIAMSERVLALRLIGRSPCMSEKCSTSLSRCVPVTPAEAGGGHDRTGRSSRALSCSTFDSINHRQSHSRVEGSVVHARLIRQLRSSTTDKVPVAVPESQGWHGTKGQANYKASMYTLPDFARCSDRVRASPICGVGLWWSLHLSMSNTRTSAYCCTVGTCMWCTDQPPEKAAVGALSAFLCRSSGLHMCEYVGIYQEVGGSERL